MATENIIFSWVIKGLIDIKPGMFAEVPEQLQTASAIEVEYCMPKRGDYVLDVENDHSVIREYKTGDRALYAVRTAHYDMRRGSPEYSRMKATGVI